MVSVSQLEGHHKNVKSPNRLDMGLQYATYADQFFLKAYRVHADPDGVFCVA